MSARRVVAALAVVLASLVVSPVTATAQTAEADPGAVCCSGIGGDDASAGGDQQNGTVISWVASEVDGRVGKPKGTSSCSPWARVVDNVLGSGPPGPNGEAMVLYSRVCDGVVQGVWVPPLTPHELGLLAFDEVRRLVSPPSVSVSPLQSVGGFVNFTAWLAVAPLPVVSATAGPLPNGLTATTSARVVEMRWDPGDGSAVVSCAPWGALPPRGTPADQAGPCSWTPLRVSAPQYSGTDDFRFHGSVSLVWSASWVASDGTSGALGSLSTTTAVPYRVREIQTIGVGR